MPRILTFCLFLFLPVSVSAQSSELSAAREALGGDDARMQVAALDSLIKTGKVSPDLYQALGNAHFQRADFGRAILSYERGLRLKPGHDRLTNNLKYVRAEAGITRQVLPDFFLARWWRAIGATLGAGTLFWLAMVFWCFAVAGAVIWFLRRKEMDEKKRFALLPGAAISLVLAILFFSIGNSRNAFLDNDREAILVAKTADLRVAPGADATLEKSLSTGLKLRVLDEFDGFVKVSLEDGKQGWLPMGSLERI
ncbi:hypothetical protein [Neolewinella persica]|uniref:hypothetical protein n=1 Tax=Neolewinella persica TaxID=70998 RepID=UPI00036A8DA0|nr:hypothetical protein [Neolewinella persica]